MGNPNILFLDTEIAKSLYAKFPPKKPEYDSYSNIIKDWWIICAAWKWADDTKIDYTSILEDTKRFKKNPTDDYHVVMMLHSVLSEADIVIGHNVEKFDWKKFNARVMFHGLEPLKMPKFIDTCAMAKSVGEFTSNSLDYLTKYFNISKKASNRGNDMWNDVIRLALENDQTKLKKVVEEITEYCIPDVTACEALYYKLLPYASARYNVNFNIASDGNVCPKCGHDHMIKRGFRYTDTGTYQAYQCKKCKGYSQDSKASSRAKRK